MNTVLTILCIILLAWWFLVGLVPVPGVHTGDFVKRHPVIFVLVALGLLGLLILVNQLV